MASSAWTIKVLTSFTEFAISEVIYILEALWSYTLYKTFLKPSISIGKLPKLSIS